MHVNINAGQIISIVSTIFAYFYSKRAIWEEVLKIVTPLIAASEEMALDGVIDKSERKKLVLEALRILEENGKIKLNWITRLIINRAIESVVKRMPDFKVAMAKNEVMDLAEKNIKG